MTHEPTNADRARWGRNALATFTAETYSGANPDTMDERDLEDAIGDLICDLLHYAKQLQFDPPSIAKRSFAHFNIELHDEGAKP